jgi:hypothetical protein
VKGSSGWPVVRKDESTCNGDSNPDSAVLVDSGEEGRDGTAVSTVGL